MLMSLKQQWNMLKENWLIIVGVLVLLFLFNTGGDIVQPLTSSFTSFALRSGGADMIADMQYAEKAYFPSPIYDEGFAPEVEDRKITKTAALTMEVGRGTFQTAEQQLKDIVKTSNSFILNENVNAYGTDRKKYFEGDFTIKVETTKYDAVLAQFKGIGEVQSFTENSDDITGTYINQEINLQVEKERLERYRQLYEEAQSVEDKLNLNDRIFNQERTIKYMEDAINTMDQRIVYSTLSVTLREKQSEYADVIWVKFSELVQTLVNSFNTLFSLLFGLVPWMILAAVGLFVWKRVRNNVKRTYN